MKQITFVAADEGRRMFKLAMLAAYNGKYQFQSEEEMRHHGKLLDAIEDVSVQDENNEGMRVLHDGEQVIVLDDAWLTLWIRMGSPPHMHWPAGGSWGKTTRDAIRMIDFLKGAKTYLAPKTPARETPPAAL